MIETPVAFFVYNRPTHTMKALTALSKNIQFNKTKLFIYCDGSKSDEDINDVKAVTKIIENFDYPIKPEIIKRENNFGLSKNIILGIEETFRISDRLIVLEDDIVTSPYFLNFMNDALSKYEQNKNVWHVSGWNYPLKLNENEADFDVFFWRVMNCWGWGTWKDRWSSFEKNPKLLIKNWNKEKISKFNLNDRFDFFKQVEDNYNGKINTWAIFWMTSIFDNNGYCLKPIESYVKNIGHDNTGENSTKSIKFDSDLSSKNIVLWPDINENFDLIINKISDQNFKNEKISILKYIRNHIRI